jgi:hypothetical protein
MFRRDRQRCNSQRRLPLPNTIARLNVRGRKGRVAHGHLDGRVLTTTVNSSAAVVSHR